MVIIIVAGLLAIILFTSEEIMTSGRLSISEIYQFAVDAGFGEGSEAITATAIALAESGGDVNAIGDTTLAPSFGPSIGLWQINVGDKAHPEMKSANLHDAGSNAVAAYKIYVAAGYSFHPWSTFTGFWSGIQHTAPYLAKLAQVQSEVSA